MIGVPAGVRVHLAMGPTDMRKGFDGLSLLVQETLQLDPFSGHLFVFRGKRGDLLKILAWDGQGFCLFAKRLEKGRFTWPSTGYADPGAIINVDRGARMARASPDLAANAGGIARAPCGR